MKDNGKIIKETEEENNCGKMGPYIRVIGKIIWLTAMAALFMQMETSIQASGRTIEQTEKELTCRVVEPSMLEIGKMINKMEMESNLGLTKLFIKDSTKMEKNTEKESLCGLMIAHIKVTFLKIIFTERVDTNGKTEEYLQVIG